MTFVGNVGNIVNTPINTIRFPHGCLDRGGSISNANFQGKVGGQFVMGGIITNTTRNSGVQWAELQSSYQGALLANNPIDTAFTRVRSYNSTAGIQPSDIASGSVGWDFLGVCIRIITGMLGVPQGTALATSLSSHGVPFFNYHEPHDGIYGVQPCFWDENNYVAVTDLLQKLHNKYGDRSQYPELCGIALTGCTTAYEEPAQFGITDVTNGINAYQCSTPYVDMGGWPGSTHTSTTGYADVQACGNNTPIGMVRRMIDFYSTIFTDCCVLLPMNNWQYFTSTGPPYTTSTVHGNGGGTVSNAMTMQVLNYHHFKLGQRAIGGNNNIRSPLNASYQNIYAAEQGQMPWYQSAAPNQIGNLAVAGTNPISTMQWACGVPGQLNNIGQGAIAVEFPSSYDSNGGTTTTGGSISTADAKAFTVQMKTLLTQHYNATYPGGTSPPPPPGGQYVNMTSFTIGTSGTPVAAATSYGGAVSATPGNLLVANIFNRSTTAVSTVTDTGGNTWVKATSTTGNTVNAELWYAKNCVSPGTFTVTWGSAVSAVVEVIEFAGAGVNAPLDVFASANGNGTSATSGFTSVAANAGELVVGFVGASGNTTITVNTSGMSTLSQDTTYVTSLQAQEQSGYFTQTTAAAATVGASLGATAVNWAAIAVLFKATGQDTLPGGGSSGIAFVRETPLAAMSAAATSYTGACTATAGNLLVLVHFARSASATITTLTDTGGNTWARANGVAGGGIDCELWYAKNCVSPGTITVHMGASTSAVASVVELSGAHLTAPLDVSHAANGSSTSPSTGSITTTNASEFLVGGIGVDNSGQTINITTAGFTQAPAGTPSANGTDTNSVSGSIANVATGYAAAGTSGAYSMGGTVTSSAAWGAVLAAFIPAPASTGTGVTPTFVQQTDITESATATTLVGSVTATAGNLLVIGITNRTTLAITSVADPANGTWSRAGGTAGNGLNTELWYVKNCLSPGTVTVTWGSAVSAVAQVLEFTNADTAAPLDVFFGSNGGSATSPSTTITTVNTNDIVVAFTGCSGSGETISFSGTSWTSGTQASTQISANYANSRPEWQFLTSAQTLQIQSSTTPAANWTGVMAAFKVAASAVTSSSPITFVAKTAITTTVNVSSLTALISSTPGNLLVANIVSLTAAGGVQSITDDAGNTWIQTVGGRTIGSNIQGDQWYCPGADIPGNLVIAFNGTGSAAAEILEFSDIDQASPADVTVSANGATGTNPDSGLSVTTSWNQDVVVGLVGAVGSGKTITSTTVGATALAGDNSTAGSGISMRSFYLFLGTTDNFELTATLSANADWVAVAASYHTPASGTVHGGGVGTATGPLSALAVAQSPNDVVRVYPWFIQR